MIGQITTSLQEKSSDLQREQNIAGPLKWQKLSFLYLNVKLKLEAGFGIRWLFQLLSQQQPLSCMSSKGYFWKGKPFRTVLTAKGFQKTDDKLLIIAVCITCANHKLGCITLNRATTVSVHKHKKSLPQRPDKFNS